MGFGRISHKAANEELARRNLFLNITSAMVTLEGGSSQLEGVPKDICRAAMKHLLRPLMAAQLEWTKAKFECRKQALSGMDFSIPQAQDLLYSSMFSEHLFAPKELKDAKDMAAGRCEGLASLLGLKKPAGTKKRKVPEGGSAHVLDR